MKKPSIVFAHGLWADGSCFSKLIVPLQAEGYECIAAQYGLNTTAEDVALVKATIGRVSSPVILVGHSYGGSVITGAGIDDRVVGLVYICALAPDADETSQTQQPTSRRPTSSPTSKSWMDVSGCVPRARSFSAATFRSRSRSSFGRPRASRNPTCSTRKSGGPPGSRSRAGTSSAKKTAPCIPIWSVFSPSAWVQPPTRSTAATCRCSPNPNACSTSSAPLPRQLERDPQLRRNGCCGSATAERVGDGG
jgi:pimeloyl-ACP methyl ester carboxylesterase